mgnify:CR=1 FL=1
MPSNGSYRDHPLSPWVGLRRENVGKSLRFSDWLESNAIVDGRVHHPCSSVTVAAKNNSSPRKTARQPDSSNISSPALPIANRELQIVISDLVERDLFDWHHSRQSSSPTTPSTWAVIHQ